ncbi:MAG: InlB B-repeat-containing protein [Lachnospiraceae bacterium]|nr:InlB B-repeat-containing protein [Lachnospiraceae bacterium]
MRYIKRILLCLLLLVTLATSGSVIVYADDIGDTGDTGQGDIGGTNVYTFSYIYDFSRDAIELQVTTKKPIKAFGNTTSHTFTSPSDQTTLNTQNPRLGNSLENAISSMISSGGYNLSVVTVKAKLNGLGYYDGGNGIWRMSGGYLTYVSAVKVRPQKHTVHYDANGGSGVPGDQTKEQGTDLYLSSTKPSRTGYTFKYWTASIGGNYNSGGKYTHDQDGGTVTMKAHWKDETDPSCSDFSATPNYWSAGNGTVIFSAQDNGSGLSSVVLQRYSNVTKSWSNVQTWSYSGTTSKKFGSYTETSEGVFYYKLTIEDMEGNVTTKTSDYIFLDHSNPVISGTENTVTTWTKVAPMIRVSATDYLFATSYNGSGLNSIVIKDDSGIVVTSGVASATYTLADKYQGINTWYIIATDNVGHVSNKTITTSFDKTGPSCSSLVATPNNWSAGNGMVSFTVRDPWSGLSSVTLQRYSYVTGAWSDVQTWTFGGTTDSVTRSYTETSEGVFYYRLILSDVLGNTSSTNSATIYLDHSNPVISGVENTVTAWTNVAPTIRVSATDYLSGTSYNGSGLRSLIIKDDSGNEVESGVTSTSYTLSATYEGIHTWYITATDNVGHVSNKTITTSNRFKRRRHIHIHISMLI